MEQDGWRVRGLSKLIVPLKYIELGVYGDLIITYPKPYSIYLRGIILIGITGVVFLASAKRE